MKWKKENNDFLILKKVIEINMIVFFKRRNKITEIEDDDLWLISHNFARIGKDLRVRLLIEWENMMMMICLWMYES
jgi:hypothetical protein